MPNKNTINLECSVAKAVEVLGDFWTLLIIRDLMLFGGVRRFESLREALDISRNILTERLNKMVENKIVRKVPITEGARRMEYQLTRKGWELMPIILSMANWGIKWKENDRPPSYAFVDTKDKQPVATPGVTGADGRVLKPSDMEIVPLTDEAKNYLQAFRAADKA
jgi:DNA-binding HxlR family transcriptional regulator